MKRYADLAGEIRGALERFAGDVRSGAFPEEHHTYSIPEEELERFETRLVGRREAEHADEEAHRAGR